MRPKPIKREDPKAGQVIYKDEVGVKQNRVWWKNWTVRNEFIEEEVSKTTILIRDTKLRLVKTLKKVS